MKLVESNKTMEIVHDVLVRPVRGRVDSVFIGTNLTGGQNFTKVANAVLRGCTPYKINFAVATYFGVEDYKERIDYRCDATMHFALCEADDIYFEREEPCIAFFDANNLLPSYTVSIEDIFYACNSKVDDEEFICKHAINLLISFIEKKIGSQEKVQKLFITESNLCNVSVKDAFTFAKGECPHNSPSTFKDVRDSFYNARVERDMNYTKCAKDSVAREKEDEKAYTDYLQNHKAITWGDVLETQAKKFQENNTKKRGFFSHRR